MKAKGLVSDGGPTDIDRCISAIKNFWILNRSSKSHRKICLLAKTELSFMSLAEYELGQLFWKNSALKEKLQDLMLEDFDDKESNPSLMDLNECLQRKPPGFLISYLLSSVGRSEPRHGSRNYKDATFIMDLDQLRQHIQRIRAPNCDPMTSLLHKVPLTPTTYKTPHYVL
ncbi:hypothetical protein BGZ51_004394 [Haplosporangium sp. Z 767]|nr:hypothetical protein BGZ51_004394 [Haplosporangium sp. Z 767]KAF9184008.1 hypothetical protein BGZ50_003941 [Haplosporangium sp. Z 11]